MNSSKRRGKQIREEGKALGHLNRIPKLVLPVLTFFWRQKGKSRIWLTFPWWSHLNAHHSVSPMLWILQWFSKAQLGSPSPWTQHTQGSITLCLPRLTVQPLSAMAVLLLQWSTPSKPIIPPSQTAREYTSTQGPHFYLRIWHEKVIVFYSILKI